MSFDPTLSAWRAKAIEAAKLVGHDNAIHLASEMEPPARVKNLDAAFADDIRLALMTGFVDGIDKSWMGAK